MPLKPAHVVYPSSKTYNLIRVIGDIRSGEGMRYIIILLIAIMLSGCLEEPVQQSMSCGGEEITDNLGWSDAYQWNGAPMSYGNTTNWTLNNTSDGQLHLNIDVVAYFSEAIGLLEQGFLNISVIQNGTLWENQTSETGVWNVSIPVNTSQEVWIELRATGKDTHPDSQYGDYFEVVFHGVTMTPKWCE